MARLFKSKLFLLILVTVILFVVMGISASGNPHLSWLSNIVNVVVSPVQKFFSSAGHKVEGSVDFFKDTKALKKENEELKKRIEKLEKENNELMVFKEKNEDFQKAFNIKNQFSNYDLLGANIIGKDLGNWFNVFTVDVGTNDGVSSNAPVVTGNGLVGRIMESGPISSKVVSIIDEGSSVSARISKTRGLVQVKGDIVLKDQGLCRVDYIEPGVDIAAGDNIETSGMGGVFPPGIIIGKVKEVRQANNELNRYAIIEPNVDFKRLEEVLVLRSKKSSSGTDRAQ
ncbi:MAG: rod shape-determining protein MreC [Clostridia bacterium]|nr:rod shape-determining protein MreC [Clostridia bacterium]